MSSAEDEFLIARETKNSVSETDDERSVREKIEATLRRKRNGELTYRSLDEVAAKYRFDAC